MKKTELQYNVSVVAFGTDKIVSMTMVASRREPRIRRLCHED